MSRIKKTFVKRNLMLIFGLFFSALGVAITKHGALGVSPVSSVANVMSEKFPALSLGNWLIVWNCVLIAGQLLLLRRDFKPFQLLQVPLSFLFGWFTDLGGFFVSGIPAELYPIRVLLVVVGTLVLGFGILLAVVANTVMNSGEAFVKAVADKTGKSFGNVKIAFDVSCVTLSVLLSLVFFGGRLVGTREGTLIAAFGTGLAVKLMSFLFRKKLEALL